MKVPSAAQVFSALRAGAELLSCHSVISVNYERVAHACLGISLAAICRARGYKAHMSGSPMRIEEALSNIKFLADQSTQLHAR